METWQRIMPYTPAVIAYIVLLIAATGKAGKERGSTTFLIGTISLLALSIVSPLFYAFALPKIIATIGVSDMERFYMILGFVSNLLWAGGITILAVGVFQRPTPGQRDASIPSIPIEHQFPPEF